MWTKKKDGKLRVYDKKQKIYFHHDFYDIDKDYEKVVEKYNRRIKRQKKVFEDKRPVKFYWQDQNDVGINKEMLKADLVYKNMNHVWKKIVKHLREKYGYSDFEIKISKTTIWAQL